MWRRVLLRIARPDAAFTFLLVLAIAGVSGAAEPQGTGRHLSSGAFAEAESKSGPGRAIPFIPSASDALGRQGFVRVINHSTEAGEVSITAFDDEGESYGPLTLSLAAHETAHFNSDDLEHGNPAKGLTGGTGAGGDGAGKWQVAVRSDQAITAMSLLSSPTGHLTNLSSDPTDALTFTFDFHRGPQGFVADFADYPPDNKEIFEGESVSSALRSRPRASRYVLRALR